MNQAVSIANLSHRYGKVQALNGVSLAIPRGVTVGLIGPDGVGKSTLLSLMAGVRIIQEGTVEVLGGNMADKKNAAGFVAPHRLYAVVGHKLYPAPSVYENVDFHARLLEAAGLAPFPDRAADKLSGGMKQKLGLCCALVHSPDLLILDEPTSGVDPAARDMFWRTLLKLSRQERITIFVSTYFMNEVERCDRISLMHQGRVPAVGTPEELLAASGQA